MSKKVTLLNVAEQLLKAGKIIITCHINPDGDAIGSTIALSEGLKQLGKDVVIVVDDEIPAFYNFIPGITEFIQKPIPETLNCDLLVVNDASSIDRIGNLQTINKNTILNIDHHPSNTEYADYLYLEEDAAATGEIIYELLKLLKVQVTYKIAFSLYVAIVTDCGFFKYSNTTQRTMTIASELLQYGVKPDFVSDNLEMKSREEITLLTKVLETLTFYAQGKIAVVAVPNELYDHNLSSDSFVQYPRYIEGVEIAILFKEVEPNVTRVSMRSRYLDISKIALIFNGGGHKKAAGCTINDNLQGATEQILKVLTDEMSKEHV